MTKARSGLREATHIKAAAPATSHLTPLSRPPSRLSQCHLGTHSPGTHTANKQALLHGSQNISVQERGEARQHSHAALPSVLLTGSQLSPLSPHCGTACGQTGGSNYYFLNRQHSICLAPICLSLLPEPDPLLLCLISRPPRTYIHTYPRPRPPPTPYMGS